MKKYNVNDIFWKYNNTEDVEKLVGKKVFAGNNYDEVLEEANNGKLAKWTLLGIGKSYAFPSFGDRGFAVENNEGEKYIYKFIIKEKEPERKPLNLNKIEVRDFLRDKWIRRKNDSYEKKITYFSSNSVGWRCCNLNASELFNDWEFIEPINGSKVIGVIEE